MTIGASAGGVETLMMLVGDLPADLPAAVFVVAVDYTVRLSDMGRLLAKLASHPPGPPASPALSLLAEVEVSRTLSNDEGRLHEIGELVPLNCAECGGPLWQMKDEKITRFRCREGHSYTAKSLAADLSEAVERSLWVAVQTLDERTRGTPAAASRDSQYSSRIAARGHGDYTENVVPHGFFGSLAGGTGQMGLVGRIGLMLPYAVFLLAGVVSEVAGDAGLASALVSFLPSVSV